VNASFPFAHSHGMNAKSFGKSDLRISILFTPIDKVLRVHIERYSISVSLSQVVVRNVLEATCKPLLFVHHRKGYNRVYITLIIISIFKHPFNKFLL
jgi:hypothetical protein